MTMSSWICVCPWRLRRISVVTGDETHIETICRFSAGSGQEPRPVAHDSLHHLGRDPVGVALLQLGRRPLQPPQGAAPQQPN